jgi:hypothetical protein
MDWSSLAAGDNDSLAPFLCLWRMSTWDFQRTTTWAWWAFVTTDLVKSISCINYFKKAVQAVVEKLREPHSYTMVNRGGNKLFGLYMHHTVIVSESIHHTPKPGNTSNTREILQVSEAHSRLVIPAAVVLVIHLRPSLRATFVLGQQNDYDVKNFLSQLCCPFRAFPHSPSLML